MDTNDALLDAHKLLPACWRSVLAPVLNSAEMIVLQTYLAEQEKVGKVIFPPRESRLRAFALTPLETVKVVILGQDPYHGAGQAHGLAFSVPLGVKVPPSLRNIHKEILSDCRMEPAAGGNLEHWAKQGVLLLNTALTVEEGRAGSHSKLGWDALTDAAISAVAQRETPCVFMLWGNPAQSKVERVSSLLGSHHLVLKAPHPSPLSAHRGFLGCRHFSQANAFLEAHGRGPIAWGVSHATEREPKLI